MMLESRPGYSGFSSGPGGQAYNEPAFRHFLGIERRRAERTMGSVLLTLVTVRNGDGRRAKLAEGTAAAIFRGLGESVREIDFVGWFREGTVAGAVLAQGSETEADKARQLMADRVTRAVRSQLPFGDTKNLSVRVIRLGARGQVDEWNQPSARALSGF